MTRVDKVCKVTQEDLTKIYQSKKIKEKMEECSSRLGVPMNCIFPLKNYHEETKLNENLNCLMLEAFTQAVHSADDYVKTSMSEDNRYYISDPTLNDKIHCLVSVIPADRVTLMDNEVIQKMKEIRAEASNLKIPQLVFMTRVDKVCRMTQEDLTKIYQSKKIKEKMEECSIKLGVPVNCIFPLKNYHEEIKKNEKLNCLMLEAFTQALHSANDYVKKFSRRET
ncbi:hypothetical protein MHYP_G00072460 [Metynnis hypsauchen]